MYSINMFYIETEEKDIFVKYFSFFSKWRASYIKGTVSREKLFSWGLGVMDWTLTIDRTWVLHFPDQLFNC